MVEFGPALRDAIRSGLCNYLGDVEKGADWVGARYPVDPGPAARAIRRPVCNDSDPEEPDPGFTGGQCAGIDYKVQLEYDQADTYLPPQQGLRTTIGSNVEGPISNIRVIRHEQENGGQFPQWTVFWSYTTPEGVVTGSSDNQTGDNHRPIVEREDGQPDDCGDPTYTPNPFPPGGVPIPISVTYVNNEGDNVTELGDFNLFAPIFAPIIAPVTTVYAPIRVNLPDIVFDGTIQLAPDFNIQLSPAGGDKSPGTPGDNPSAPGEDPTTAPPTDEDESNEGLLGVHVRSEEVTSSRASQIFNNPGPDLFVPRLCSVFFRVRMGGRLSWLGPIDVKGSSAWVPVPQGTLAVGWDLRPEPGWESTAIPVYGRIPDTEV